MLYPAATLGAVLAAAPVLRFVGNPIILEFALGILVAVAPRRIAWGGPALLAGAAGLAASLALDLTRMSEPGSIFDLSAPWRVLVWGIPGALIVWGALQLEPLVKGRWADPAVYMGDASYALYLSHGLAMMFMPMALKIPVAILFAAGVYRYVEQPMLKAARSLVRATPRRLAKART